MTDETTKEPQDEVSAEKPEDISVVERNRVVPEPSESIQRVITENPDSIEVGTPKTGKFKVYGNFDDLEAFKKKIDNAKIALEYAQADVAVNI